MKNFIKTIIGSMLLLSISCLAADMPAGLGDLVNTMKGIAEQANKQKKTEESNVPQPPQPTKQVEQSQQNSQLEHANEEAANSKQEAERAKEEAVMAKQEAMLARQEAERANQEAAIAKQEAEKLKAEGVTIQPKIETTSSTAESSPTDPLQQEATTEVGQVPVVQTPEPVPEVTSTREIEKTTTTNPVNQEIEVPKNNSTQDESLNLEDVTLNQWLLYIYIAIATAIGTLFVRPPLMKWWKSQIFFVRGDNVVHVFFKQFGMRLTWEIFVLAVSAVLGIFGGAVVYACIWLVKRKKASKLA